MGSGHKDGNPHKKHRSSQYREAAREYIRAIKTVQNTGPVPPPGTSWGISYVYEIALQLEKNGEKTAFLGLDPYFCTCPGSSDI